MNFYGDDYYDPMFKSYLSGSSQAPSYGGSAAQVTPAQVSPAQAGASAMQKGSMAAAPFMMTPAGAALTVGSQFLSQYMAQKAADERAKRERMAQIAQEQGQGEQRGLEQLINVYRGALR